MRSQGMGWGQIAQKQGTKLGPVISGLKNANQQMTTTNVSSTEANQPARQALLFPAVENLTAIPARTSRDKTGRVKVSSVVPTGPRLAAMLTAGALCRDQVKRVVETAASQRLVVMAIQDKPKVKASSISRKDTEMKAAKSIVLRGARSSYSSLS